MVAAEALERPAGKEFLGAEVKRGCQNDERLARTNKFCRKHWKSPGALISHADEIIEKKQTQPIGAYPAKTKAQSALLLRLYHCKYRAIIQ